MKEWERITALMRATKTLTPFDMSLLWDYCQIHEEILSVSRDIQKMQDKFPVSSRSGMTHKDSRLTYLQQLRAERKSLSAELGITPVTRDKAGINFQPESEEARKGREKADKFFPTSARRRV